MATGTIKPSAPAREEAVTLQPSASYSITLRVRLPAAARLVRARRERDRRGRAAILGAIDLVRVESGTKRPRHHGVLRRRARTASAVVAAVRGARGRDGRARPRTARS